MPNAPTYQVRIACPPAEADALEQLLWALPHVVAVTVHYGDNSDDLEAPDDVTGLSVLSTQPGIEDHVRELLNEEPSLREAGCAIDDTATLMEADWAEAWKAHWDIVHVTPRLTIRPSWKPYRPTHPEEIVIDLDPGMAFGTGTHETTNLMLRSLERLADRWSFAQVSVMDVGTGSGILAIYAAKRGCRNVLAIDNDPHAVLVASDNAKLNNVTHALTMTTASLHEMCRTPVDVVVMNIIAPVILDLLPEVKLRVKSGSVILLSGIIERTLEAVCAALKAAGFIEIETWQEGPWFAVEAVYGG
ncbi:MAG: 50S ribosomal protein L11 methyltransferase [Candidatus Melainabacteria bacterium]